MADTAPTATPSAPSTPAAAPPAPATPDPFVWAEDVAAEAAPEPAAATPAPEAEADAPEPAEAGSEPLEGEPEASGEKGSESAPLSPEEVPEQWVKVRVDGQDAVINLREAVQAGIRTATFQRRMQQLAETTKAVEARAAELEQADETVRTFVDRLGSDAEYARAWLRHYAPKSLSAVVEAEIRERLEDAERKPEERAARELAQERARLEHERETWRQEQVRLAQEQATREAQSALRPLLEQAAEANDLPFSREYIALMRTALEPVFEAGRGPTKAEIQQAAKEIARWRGMTPKPAPAPPKPPPAPAPPAARSPNGSPKRKAALPADSRSFFAALRSGRL